MAVRSNWLNPGPAAGRRFALALCGLLLVGARASNARVASSTTPHPTQQASLPSAREIVDRHIRSVGGREALLKLRSRYVWAKYERRSRQVSGNLEVFAARPNKRVIKIEYPDVGKKLTGYNGEIGWTADPDKSPVRILGRELTQLRDESVFDVDLHDDVNVRSMETVRSVTWAGRPCYELRVVSTTGRQWLEYFDVETGLFAGSEARRETAKGPITLRTVVSSYKEYDGVQLPSRLSLKSGGTEEIITVRTVEHNGVKDAVFEPPASLKKVGER
jgi:hypothetical protein